MVIIMKLKNCCCYLVIFLFTFTYFGFFNSENYINFDDTIFHTTNILTLASEINLSNLFPGKIVPVMVNNLGYGINLFYPIFPHLIASYIFEFFSLFDMGIASTMKFVNFMIIFLAGVFMYKYINITFKNRKQALVSAIMYQSMPYMFSDVFMRGALNESFIFIYLPIIFLSFYYLFESEEYNKFYFLFILGYSLLIFTHIVMAVYLMLFLIPVMLVYYKKLFRKEIISKLVIGSILILLITSNFWGPMLEHYFLDNYYIFRLQYDGSNDVDVLGILYYLFPIRSTDLSFGFFLVFNILPVCLGLMVSNLGLLYKREIGDEHRKILIGISLFFIISLLFASNKWVWSLVPNILKNIQFSWRLALFIAFGAVVIGGYGIRLFNKRIQTGILLFIICFCGVSNYVLSSQLNYVLVDNVDYLDESCCSWKWSYEYLPVAALDWSGKLVSKGEELGIRALNNTKIIDNDVPNMSFEVFDTNGSLIVEFPRIYYLGYELRHEDGKVISLYQNDYGLLEAVVDRDGYYYLEYKGTLIDRTTRILAFGAVIGWVCLLIWLKGKE